LGLHAVPRGAGTGLTGGAVPLEPDCIVVNTEKLNRIHGIDAREFKLPDGRSARASVLRLEAGVITEHAMEHAAGRGLVFATDPTSAWASTIGGNISENAGGKTAVLWGSCLDNLLAYAIAMPGGVQVAVRRRDHPLRKILPDDLLEWEVRDGTGTLQRVISIRGDAIRRRGLWKDITNKTLQGLPGVQKEGTDGVITSAEFVLYPQYEAVATLCLEFFGPDMEEASRVIHEIVGAFPIGDTEVLQALEHFDDEYVRAIGYQVKAARAGTPKAVLLIDIVGHDAAQTARGVGRIRAILEGHANTHLFEASDRAEARRFWDDRKKLGAIAARTNAFKLNEDIVLPLAALAPFARFCAGVNLEEERHAQHAFLVRAATVLRDAPAGAESPWLAGKTASAVALCEQAQKRLAAAKSDELSALSIPAAVRSELGELLRGYDALVVEIDAVHEDVRRRRIVIATHMHAGDGNVHVNIPVMSNDRIMMRRAERVVDRVMETVAGLGGVCSGEHGIGITKLKYLDEAILRDLAAYRAQADPQGLMNPGKLADRAVLQHIFTPSFNLLKLEARILQFGKLEELALKIAQCVRCGKCKPDCCVFHPEGGLFHHPRNKNLAIGALIEALLYGAQRERSARFGILRELEDVADHCTICHKCLKPCPVSIDTGEVSVLERGILVARGLKHT
ncbi:MAG: FAD-binding protein, partial [Verrucomicrobia bacterium]|nr:FAD-binding protein [Verrucomicrobiota bacterium]